MIVYRNISGIETKVCEISDINAVHKTAIMDVDEIDVSVVVDNILDLNEEDYTYFNGTTYTLNRDAEYTIKAPNEIEYSSIVFEHPYYRFLDKILLYKITGDPIFYLTGTLADFVELVIWNINKTAENPLGVDIGWSIGSVIATTYKNIYFNASSCKDALVTLSNEFDCEFYFKGKELYFVSRIENVRNIEFEQGRGNGLFDVTQRNVDKEDTVTRIYPVGGSKNVPNVHADSEGRLRLPERFIENFTDFKRVIEKRVAFDDVFPKFVGNVDSVSGTNNSELLCSAIDFDLNTVAVGDNARINFLTGDLMGISFKFAYNNSAKKITLIAQEDETSLPDDTGTKPNVPNPNKKAKAGDAFNFTGVLLPDSYVQNSISELRSTATTWLNKNSKKRVSFDLTVDYRWMRGKQPLAVGDVITVKIPQKNLTINIRIVSLSVNLDTGSLEATVSNYLEERWSAKVDGTINKVIDDISESTKQAERVNYDLEQSKAIQRAIKEITDFFTVNISDGGLITGNTIILGGSSGANTGITGLEDQAENSVWLWSGEDFENRYSAITRFYRNGKMVSSDVDLTGKVTAQEGKIAGFSLSDNRMEALNYDALGNPTGGKFALYNGGGADGQGYIAFISPESWAGFGANVFPLTSGLKGVARFENNSPNPFGENYGAYFSASGGGIKNIAALIRGDVKLESNSTIRGIQVLKRTIAANYTIDEEGVIICVASCIVTMPPNPSDSRVVTIGKLNSGSTITLNGNGKNIRIRGSESASIPVAWFATFQFDLPNNIWVMISEAG